MLETSQQYRPPIPAVLPVHNNSHPQTKWVTYSALRLRLSIFKRMRVKADWKVQMLLQAREPMTSSVLMLLLHHNSSHNNHKCKCSKIRQHQLKTIILSQAIYWTYSQQISLLVDLKINSRPVPNLMISSTRAASHWPQHNKTSPLMTNTLS